MGTGDLYNGIGKAEDIIQDAEKNRDAQDENVHFDFIYKGNSIPKLVAPKKRILDVYTVLEMVVAY